VGAAIAGAGAIGCGGRSQTATTAPTATTARQPKKGGTLIHAGGNTVGGADTEGVELDPQISQSAAARGFRLVYQGLLGYDPRTYAIQPEIAAKWEQASPTEVVLTLQPGVRWQDKPPANGRDLTAEDVVFSLNRIRGSEPKFSQRSLFANFDKVEAVDKTRVRVTTKAPDATVLSYLSADPAMMVAPEVVQKYDKILSADAVVGTGAFTLKTLEEKVVAEYVRNPGYWKSGRPYLDAVRTQHLSDTGTAYAAFQAGQVDVLYLPGAEVKGYIDKQGAGYKPDWFNDDTTVEAFPNVRAKPMDDARVTRALRLLIDHDEFSTAWAEPAFGRGSYGSIFCPALAPWDLSQEEYGKLLEWKKPKDDAVKEAVSLLAAAGYAKDKPLSFELAGRSGGFLSSATQLLQAQWARLGQGVVKTTIKEYDLPSSYQVLANHSFAYFVVSNAGAFPDPDAWLGSMYRTGGSLNFAGASDPSLDAMIDKQRTLLDSTQRHASVKEIVSYMVDHGPTTIPSNRYFLNAVKPKVQGFFPEFYINGRQYEGVWLDA
jgi:peptide/nickel transport system substrate-binding protein